MPNSKENVVPFAKKDAAPKQASGFSEFVKDNKNTIITVVASTLAFVGLVAAVFATAGTTLPLVIGAAAKIGLNLGFLASMGMLAASTVVTSVVTAVVAAVSASLYGIAKGISAACTSIKAYFNSRSEAAAKPKASGAGAGAVKANQQPQAAAEQADEEAKNAYNDLVSALDAANTAYAKAVTPQLVDAEDNENAYTESAEAAKAAEEAQVKFEQAAAKAHKDLSFFKQGAADKNPAKEEAAAPAAAPGQ